MSPSGAGVRSAGPCFPRVSGDEPRRLGRHQIQKGFSPRERG